MLVISMVTLVTLVAASTPLTELSTITSRHTKLSSVSPSSSYGLPDGYDWLEDKLKDSAKSGERIQLTTSQWQELQMRMSEEDFENLIELFRNLSGPTIDVPSYLLVSRRHAVSRTLLFL